MEIKSNENNNTAADATTTVPSSSFFSLDRIKSSVPNLEIPSSIRSNELAKNSFRYVNNSPTNSIKYMMKSPKGLSTTSTSTASFSSSLYNQNATYHVFNHNNNTYERLCTWTNIISIFGGIISSGLCFIPMLFQTPKQQQQQENSLSLSFIHNSIIPTMNFKCDEKFFTLLTIGLAISCYKLIEFLVYWYRSSHRSVTYFSSQQYYFAILLSSTLMSGLLLHFITSQHNNVLLIASVILAATVLTVKAVMRICLDSYSLTWKQLMFHILLLLSFGLSEALVLLYLLTNNRLHLSYSVICLISSFTLIGWELDVKIYQEDTSFLSFRTFTQFISLQKSEVTVIGIFLISKFICRMILMMISSIPIGWFALCSYISYVTLVMIFSQIPQYMLFDKFYSAIDDLNAKSTYVSYTTHEVRSPLTTVALGIDLLINEITTKSISCSNANYNNRDNDNNSNNDDHDHDGNKSIDLNGIVETLKDLKTSSELSLSVVNDILTLDKFQANKITIEPTLVLAWEFVHSCVRPFYIQAKSAAVKLNCRVTDGFCIEEHALFIDKSRAEAIVRNLVSNAIKFSPKLSQVDVILSLQSGFSTRPDDSFEERKRKKSLLIGTVGVLRVSVTDHGVGISKINQAKLFNLFVQIDPSKLQAGKGSGIGLWLTKQMIEVHGGVIGVESEGEGHGSTFYFELPCFQADFSLFPMESGIISSAKMPTPIATPTRLKLNANNTTDNSKINSNSVSTSKASSPTTTKRKVLNNVELKKSPSLKTLEEAIRKVNDTNVRKYKVLMVDDMALIRKFVCRSIESLCEVFEEASDGAEAISIMSSKNISYFDVILIDGYMPKMNGFEAVRIIRDMDYLGLIFGVTGSSSNDDRDEFLQSGANEVLQKPLDLKKLREAIDTCVGARM